jgi:ribonuclease P protein component
MTRPGLPSFKLPRSAHIKHGRDFTRIKTEGKRMARGCLTANWAPSPEGQTSRLGLITSRRIGKAVQRNRARRLLREAFRLNQHSLSHSIDLVLIARPSIAGKSFDQVEVDFKKVMRMAGLLQPDSSTD